MPSEFVYSHRLHPRTTDYHLGQREHLIESVFDIQGFGLLQYQALLGRDQTVIMGTLTIAAFLLVLGNILSDLIVAMVDPRVKFNRLVLRFLGRLFGWGLFLEPWGDLGH